MSKIMKKLGSLLLVVTMIVSMTACGSGGNSAVGDENSITMRYALTEELNSLDPNYNYSATSMGMITNVNQGLMKYGTDGKITNGLAENESRHGQAEPRHRAHGEGQGRQTRGKQPGLAQPCSEE